MSILLIAEHDNTNIKNPTLSTIKAAGEIGGEVDLLVVGENCSDAADHATSIHGINKVLLADNPVYANFLAENISLLVADLAEGYDYVLAAATTNGKNILPRVAALIDTQMISDIISVESSDTFKRPIYAGNVIATVQSTDAKKVITVRATAFESVEVGNASVEKVAVDKVFDAGVSSFLSEEIAESDRPELTAANIVISGGRGMQNGDNFKLIESIADKLNAAMGASRAAVDAGFVPNDMQVGQTGKIVAPDLYIAVGISGAIQHLAGMKDSKIIVAINKDEDAPIFQVADYGLVADLFDALPALESQL